MKLTYNYYKLSQCLFIVSYVVGIDTDVKGQSHLTNHRAEPKSVQSCHR